MDGPISVPVLVTVTKCLLVTRGWASHVCDQQLGNYTWVGSNVTEAQLGVSTTSSSTTTSAHPLEPPLKHPLSQRELQLRLLEPVVELRRETIPP